MLRARLGGLKDKTFILVVKIKNQALMGISGDTLQKSRLINAIKTMNFYILGGSHVENKKPGQTLAKLPDQTP